MNKRIAGLDGLRAIFIIAIIFYHMIPETVSGGFIGVNGFFVLMGFLMVYGTKNHNLKFKDYYFKKVKRLYPALLITLSLLIIAILIFARNYRSESLPEVFSIIFGYNNYYQINVNSSYFTRMLNASPFTHLWYIGLTIQYYLVWPIFFEIIKLIYKHALKEHYKSPRAVVIVFETILFLVSSVETFLLYSPKKDSSRIYYGFDTRAFTILMGMILCEVYFIIRESKNEKLNEIKSKLKNLSWYETSLVSVIFFVVLAVILKMCLNLRGEEAITYRGMMQLSALLFSVLIGLMLLDQERLAKWCDNIVFKTIGDYSYEAYLVMYPIIWFVGRKFGGVVNIEYMVVTTLLIVVFSYLVSFLSGLYLKMVEKSFSSEKYSLSFVRNRMIPSVLLMITLLLSIGQSAYAKSLGGHSDIETMKAGMELNQVLSSQQQKIDKNLKASLSSLGKNVDFQTAVVEQNAAARLEQNTEDDAVKQAAEARMQDVLQKKQEALSDSKVSNVTTVTAIGDSVMVGAMNKMYEKMPGIYIDAKESRQITVGTDIVSKMASNGTLGNIIIVHLGTNGAMTVPKYLELIDAAGPNRTIYWVTSHGVSWGSVVNANISAAASERGNVKIVDWDSYASGHSEWFYSDGIHLKPEGQEAYADFIKSSCGL